MQQQQQQIFKMGSGAQAEGRIHSNLFLAPALYTRAAVGAEAERVNPHANAWLGDAGVWFDTSEAFWQALKAKDARTFLRFARGGDLADFSPQFWVRLGMTPDKAAKKYTTWAKRKGNLAGIVCKLASNAKHGRKLGLSEANYAYEREFLAPDVEHAVWLALLACKYAQNPELAAALRATAPAKIVEVDNKARAWELSGQRRAYWGGYWDEHEQRLYGENKMGQYVQAVRELLE
jgi:hypothetical protein